MLIPMFLPCFYNVWSMFSSHIPSHPRPIGRHRHGTSSMLCLSNSSASLPALMWRFLTVRPGHQATRPPGHQAPGHAIWTFWNAYLEISWNILIKERKAMADMDKIWKTMRKFWKDTSQVTELKGTVCSGKSRNVLDGNSTARWGRWPLCCTPIRCLGWGASDKTLCAFWNCQFSC